MAANPLVPFATLQRNHPRLIVTREFIDRATNAIRDPAGQRIKRKVVEDAVTFLGQRMVKREDPDDDDFDFLNEVRDVLRRFQTLAMAWFFDANDPGYLQRIREELAVICGFPDWNPAHFLDTAEMTHAVAIAYDWFYHQLTPDEHRMCQLAILEKGLRRGYDQLTGTPRPNWPVETRNWNIVCNASLIMGALAIAEDVNDPLPEIIFQRCLDSVPTGFDGYSPDGGWDEGPGYWAYATEYAAYLLSSLRTALQTEFGLADLPGFRLAGEFRMHVEGAAVGDRQFRRFFNFSDCEEQRRGSWCLRWLAWRFCDERYTWMAHKDAQARPMDLFWYAPQPPFDPNKSLRLNKVFTGRANVAMLRAAWGTKAAAFHAAGFQPWAQPVPEAEELFLGIRAGANSRQNGHGHLDLGSFVLDALKERWATDLEPVEHDYYLPGYFDVEQGRRFRYYRPSTAGHNTLLINGFNQALDIETEIVAFREVPGLVVVVADLTPAYPDCLRIRRGFALVDGLHVFIVDEIVPKKKMTVTWQMHTRAVPEEQGNRVVLTKGRKKFFVELMSPERVALLAQPATVTQPGEGPNLCDVRKLVATFTKVKKPLRIEVHLSPQPNPPRPLPGPLNEPLWRWICWAGETPATPCSTQSPSPPARGPAAE